jgi:hypothetical protein
MVSSRIHFFMTFWLKIFVTFLPWGSLHNATLTSFRAIKERGNIDWIGLKQSHYFNLTLEITSCNSYHFLFISSPYKEKELHEYHRQGSSGVILDSAHHIMEIKTSFSLNFKDQTIPPFFRGFFWLFSLLICMSSLKIIDLQFHLLIPESRYSVHLIRMYTHSEGWHPLLSRYHLKWCLSNNIQGIQSIIVICIHHTVPQKTTIYSSSLTLYPLTILWLFPLFPTLPSVWLKKKKNSYNIGF